MVWLVNLYTPQNMNTSIHTPSERDTLVLVFTMHSHPRNYPEDRCHKNTTVWRYNLFVEETLSHYLRLCPTEVGQSRWRSWCGGWGSGGGWRMLGRWRVRWNGEMDFNCKYISTGPKKFHSHHSLTTMRGLEYLVMRLWRPFQEKDRPK